MKIDFVSTSVLSAFVLSLQLTSTRLVSKALQPFVKLMLHLFMPSFLYRFMMQ